MISWSPPQQTNGRLTGYTLSIEQLLDYGMPVSGSAKNASVDVIMTSYNLSGLCEHGYAIIPLNDINPLSTSPRSTLPDMHPCS